MNARVEESQGSRWLAPVLILVVSVTVAGGLWVRDLYQRSETSDPGALAVPQSQSLAPHEQPGSSEVQLSTDAARHPHSQTVRGLLQAYIDGINERNYDKWKTSVTLARINDKPEDAWLEAYRSTTNGSVVVHRIETAPDDRLRVLVGFTSTQDAADAPEKFVAECIKWRLVLPLTQEDGHWKIDVTPPGSPVERSRC